MEEINEGLEQDVQQTPAKTYTEQELNALLQQEGDRRVSEALKKAEKKNAEKIKEAQRLAQMNEQEKYEYQLQEREKAIQEKEDALSLLENKNEASKILAEKGISLSLVDFIVAKDAETMKANIDLLDKAFKESVKAEVEKRMVSSSPKKNLPLDNTLTPDGFNKMTLQQQMQIYKNNPDLYKQMVGK